MKLILSEPRFEYDIRGMIMSFFPGEAITTDETVSDDHSLTVIYGRAGEPCRIFYNGAERSAADEKTAVKRAVYDLLSEATGKTLPWGTLSGIRPTKIPMAYLNRGETEAETRRHLTEDLYVSDKKTALAIDIAKRENRILSGIDYRSGYSLYVGIPFCPTTCLYCSFTSYPIARYEAQVWDYLRALTKELEYAAEAFRGQTLDSVYFGGGTPTTLTPEQLDYLCGRITGLFDLSKTREWTVEAGRPDSVTRDKLLTLKNYPVTRISVNPQTMHQATLDLIGRRHTVEDVRRTYAMARELGFDNINMDLIIGLPGEDKDMVEATMKEVTALNPDNVTIHSLAIKRAARLNIMREAYMGFKMENTDEIMDMCADYLAGIGQVPYYLYRQKNMAGNLENVGYARPGKEGLYNILIMEEVESIVACGAGASTKRVSGERIERAENVKNVEIYIRDIDEMIERKRRLFEADWG